MLIVDFPTLINPIEYVEFFNPSGICELRLNKSKLKFKYDWLVQYIRSRGLNDADNITALLDYRTGKSISRNLRQYSQFTIIRHISRHILINDTYFWEAMGMRSKSEFTIADHSNSTLSSHDFIEIIRHDSYKILLDDFDFVIGTLKYFIHDIDIYCQIPDRIKLNKKFIKTILSDYPDHIDHIANFIETVKPPCLRDIQFVLSLKNIIYIYTGNYCFLIYFCFENNHQLFLLKKVPFGDIASCICLEKLTNFIKPLNQLLVKGGERGGDKAL